jgi:hypothetical protein
MINIRNYVKNKHQHGTGENDDKFGLGKIYAGRW